MNEFIFEKAPAISPEALIRKHIRRGRAVGFISTPVLMARLYYDSVDDRFAMQVGVVAGQSRQFGGEIKLRRGRADLVFMRIDFAGFAVPAGHGELQGDRLFIKLARGSPFFFKVNPKDACFSPLVNSGAIHKEPEHLSEADLRRLRGTVDIHERGHR